MPVYFVYESNDDDDDEKKSACLYNHDKLIHYNYLLNTFALNN